jgi:glycosyltransferase involved in cell wall biosynthesis
MRVLQVINTLDTGGAEVLLSQLVLRMRQRNVDIEVATLHLSGSRLEQQILDAGVNLYSVGVGSVYSPLNVLRLAGLIKDYDIVHAHLFPTQLWVAMAGCFAKKQPVLVTTEHSTYNRRRRFHFRRLDQWIYSRYQAIPCISEGTLSALREWILQTGAKATLIHNGVPLDELTAAKSAHRDDFVPPNHPVLISVGSLQEIKNFGMLIRSIVDVPNVEVIIIGEGSLGPALKQLARDLKVDKRVHFLGLRSDVPHLVKMADIYVQPSHWEGFGIAVLEAMAVGVPVIASNVPGLSSVVGGAGILVSSTDHKALASQISRLIELPTLRAELSRKGAERALEFNIDKTVDAYLRLYSSLLQNKPEDFCMTR